MTAVLAKVSVNKIIVLNFPYIPMTNEVMCFEVTSGDLLEDTKTSEVSTDEKILHEMT